MLNFVVFVAGWKVFTEQGKKMAKKEKIGKEFLYLLICYFVRVNVCPVRNIPHVFKLHVGAFCFCAE